jgi:mxaD protein
MLQLRLSLACLSLGALSFTASAHGPTPQKVDESIEIAAPPAKVWELVKDFGAISSWSPAVTKSEGTGGNGTGASRSITLKSGGELQEGLDYYSEPEMTYLYRLSKEKIDVLPVSSYTAELKVAPADGGGSKVSWVGRFYRADTGNEPAPDKNDAAAIKAMKAFIDEGLAGLKAKAEAK